MDGQIYIPNNKKIQEEKNINKTFDSLIPGM